MSKELKILINNEEVVCDKQISIDEKMLSTSSTILKNCYPKFWETDKDYVSRFYFPKDYSKCRISYDEFHPEEQGEIVTGTNLSINYDSTKNFELLQLQGNTYQQTYTGKNLLKNTSTNSGDNNYWSQYSTYDQTTGTLTRSTSGTTEQFIRHQYNLKNNTKYTISCLAKSNGYVTNFEILAYNSTASKVYGSGRLNLTQNFQKYYLTFTTDSSTNFTNANIRFDNNGSTTSGTTATLTIKDVMLVEGEDTNFEPYVGGTPSPNPDYPQAINNVTGRQTIDVVGKNFFDKDKSCNYKSNNDVVEVNINTGKKISWTSSTSSTYKFVDYAIMDLTNFVGKTIRFKCNFNASGSNIAQYYIGLCDKDGNNRINKSQTTTSGTTLNFTVPELSGEQKYLCLALYVNTTGTLSQNDYVEYTNMMLTIDDEDMTYEEYKGQSYEINLGKNLFDKSNANILNAYFNLQQGIVSNNDTRSIYIKCQPNTTYTIQKSGSVRFRIGTTSSVPNVGTSILNITSDDTASVLTITTPSNAQYLIAYIYGGFDTNPKTFDEVLETVQIEYGSTASSYSSYFTPIELNKIGNYQDRIYKENGTWYIEKKIGKVVLDGTENWTMPNPSTYPNLFDYNTGISDSRTTLGNTQNSLCNYYSWYNKNTARNTQGYNLYVETTLRIRICNKSITSTTNFKTWLSTHNTEIYYVLNTPTYTEITNEDLINQLESIELLNGINNIMVSSGDLPGALNIHYNFKEAYTESDLVFCGIVKNTGNISLNPREPHFVDLQILDFKTLLSEGETLNYVITDKTIPKAIEQVVESISDYGFVIGNINILNPNDKINAYSTLNKTAYDVFQYIADVTQSKWATRVIDEDTIAIDFYDPTLMPKASPIEYNQTYFENNDIENMTFNYSTNDYRNKQIMTSDEVFGNIEQIETIISNGYQDTYTCQNKIGIIKKITVNDVECTFATKNEVELGVTADFEYQPGEMTFTSNQTYSAGAIIIITYYPIVKGREIILNSGESTRITNQINRKGTISRYENRNDTTSGQELIKIGQSYIKYKGSAEITLKIVSSKNLFNVGQIVEFNAPLEELSTEYMVKNKTIDIWNIDSNETQVFYTYELSSNFNSENAINYFDNQRAKNQGNIGEGETIVRNIDIENTVLIQFYETNIEEVEISNISTLDFSLDAVLI